MKLGLRTEFKVDKTETAPNLARAIHASLERFGLSDASLLFSMREGSAKKVSSVDRVLRRYPELVRFAHSLEPWLGAEPDRAISNELHSPMHGQSVEFETLIDILSGVPRSFPFFSFTLRWTHDAFGSSDAVLPQYQWPGVSVADAWGLSKRKLSLSSVAIVEADPAAAALPQLPESVSSVLAACGKVRSTSQNLVAGQSPDVIEAVSTIERDLKAQLAALVHRARLPHDFAEDADTPTYFGIGPLKPPVVSAFRPLGYDVRAEGMMVLTCRRRTASNLSVRLHLDFGTRGDKIHPTYQVRGLGFQASIPLPVSPGSIRQNLHWLVDAPRWQHIVENLAALVTELDRSFVPAIEAVSGPSPAWCRPETTG